jgi:hypothetical protein
MSDTKSIVPGYFSTSSAGCSGLRSMSPGYIARLLLESHMLATVVPAGMEGEERGEARLWEAQM